MKKILLGIVIGLGFLGITAHALSVFLPIQGGTGTSTPSGILYGDNGATSHLNTVKIGTGCTFSGGILSCLGVDPNWTITGGYLSPTTTISILVGTTTPSIIGNFNTIRDASQYAGSDIGAKINSAYASCPSTGCEITVPGGTWDYSTPIVAATDGKPLLLVCPVGGGHFDNAGTVLHYTASTGKAITFDTNNFVVAGMGITNCSFIGPAGSGGIGSISTSTSAVYAGGTHGAFGLHLDNFHASGFGTGLEIGSNVSFLNITNSVINKNARQIVSPQISGANGENMRVSNTVLADGNNNLFGNSIANYCVDIQLSGNVQWTFDQVSFDDCQLYSEQSGGTSNIIHVTNSHFEDPNLSIAAYDYVSTLSNQPAFTYVSTGNDYMQDFTSGAPSEFITSGGNVISQGDVVSLNNNVTIPMTNFVNLIDNLSTETFEWSGLTQGYANTGASAAVTNAYNGHPYSPAGYGSGLTAVGASFKIRLPSTTDNGTTTIANLGGVIDATTYSQSDIGAQVNAAYASCPKKACIITIPRGKYIYSTPIVFGVDGKRALLMGTPAEGTELDYTGTGAAITINTGDQNVGIDHTAGNGLDGIYLRGNNYSTTSPQIGVFVGGTNGADGVVLQNVNIYTFGYGLQLGANNYHFMFQNGIIRDNGQNVHINAASNSGESIDFVNAFIVDGGQNDAIDCFWMDNSATASLNYTGGSLDDCQMHVLQANNVTITGTHFENPGSRSGGWGPYTYIIADNNLATNIDINGATFFDTSGNGLVPPNYIANGGNVTLNGVIVRQFSGSTMTNFMTLTGSGRVSWMGLNDVSGTAFTNVVSGVPYTTNGTTGAYTLQPLATAAGAFLAVNTTGQIIATTSPIAASQSPWIENINAAGFNLTNVGLASTTSLIVSGNATTSQLNIGNYQTSWKSGPDYLDTQNDGVSNPFTETRLLSNYTSHVLGAESTRSVVIDCSGQNLFNNQNYMDTSIDYYPDGNAVYGGIALAAAGNCSAIPFELQVRGAGQNVQRSVTMAAMPSGTIGFINSTSGTSTIPLTAKVYIASTTSTYPLEIDSTEGVAGALGTPLFSVLESGKIGVATSSPSDIFTVSTGNNQGIRVSSSNAAFLEVGQGNASRFRIENNFTQAGQLEFLYGNGTGGAPGTTAMTIVGNPATAGSVAGNVGIGTTTPTALLSLDNASSTAASSQKTPFGYLLGMAIDGVERMVESFDYYGHLYTSGPAPTVSGGTSTMNSPSNDQNGSIAVAGVALTSVTMTFAHPWLSAPSCQESDNVLAVATDITSISTTQVVIGFGTGGVTSATVWYRCTGSR